MKKMGFWAMFAVLCLLSQQSLANPATLFDLVAPYEIILESNIPQVFPNVFMWTVKGKCTVVSDQEENHLNVMFLKRAGSVNGIKLAEGGSIDIIVHPNEVIHATAEANSKIQFLNTGVNTFKATCVSEN
jgi:hypothetical protein